MMSLRARYDAARVRDLASRFEMLLDQAQGFARGGDYLGAQARARLAQEELTAGATSAQVADADIVELRAHLDLRLRHYDRLARDWRQQSEARHIAYLVRERQAIGAPSAQPSGPVVRQTGFGQMVRRLWTGAFRRSAAGAMRMGRAP